jgi:2'-5' RNA ligase
VSERPLRLFAGLPVAARPARALEIWTREHAPAGWRAVPAANLHVTLVFLGATAADELSAVGAALREALADVAAVELGLRPARRFGGVLALPLADADGGVPAPLAAAQGRLAAALDRAEDRPWTPHVTVARPARRGRPPLPAAAPPPLVLRLDEAVLYASEHAPGGVTYRPLASLLLKQDALHSDADDSLEPGAPPHPHGRGGGRGDDPDRDRGPEEGDP